MRFNNIDGFENANVQICVNVKCCNYWTKLRLSQYALLAILCFWTVALSIEENNRCFGCMITRNYFELDIIKTCEVLFILLWNKFCYLIVWHLFNFYICSETPLTLKNNCFLLLWTYSHRKCTCMVINLFLQWPWLRWYRRGETWYKSSAESNYLPNIFTFIACL